MCNWLTLHVVLCARSPSVAEAAAARSPLLFGRHGRSQNAVHAGCFTRSIQPMNSISSSSWYLPLPPTLALFFLLAVQRPSQTGCRARTFRLRRAACFKPSWSRVVCVMCTATEKDASASLRRLLTQNLKRWTHAQSVTCKIAHVIYDVIGSAGRWCVCGGRRGAAAKGEDDDAGARRTDAERSMGQGRRCAAEQRRQQMRNDLGHKCCWARLRGCEVDGVGRRARRKR